MYGDGDPRRHQRPERTDFRYGQGRALRRAFRHFQPRPQRPRAAHGLSLDHVVRRVRACHYDDLCLPDQYVRLLKSAGLSLERRAQYLRAPDGLPEGSRDRRRRSRGLLHAAHLHAGRLGVCRGCHPSLRQLEPAGRPLGSPVPAQPRALRRLGQPGGWRHLPGDQRTSPGQLFRNRRLQHHHSRNGGMRSASSMATTPHSTARSLRNTTTTNSR